MYTYNRIVLGAIVLALIVLLIPLGLRDTPFSDVALHHTAFQEEQALHVELLGRSEYATPYDLLLLIAPFPLFWPILFGLLSIYVSSRIIPKHLFWVATGIALLTPLFIVAFTFNNPYSLILLLNLVGILLIKEQSRFVFLPYLFLAFFGLGPFLASVLLFFALKGKPQDMLFPAVAFVGFFFTTGFQLPVIAFQPSAIFPDVGSKLGVGFFGYVLAIVGFVKLWKSYKQFVFPLFLIALGSLFISSFVYFLLPIVAYLGAVGIYMLWKQKWDLPNLKQLTIFILILGLLFSQVSFVSRMPEMTPTHEQVQAMIFLQGQPEGVVLTHPTRGSWVRAYADQPVLLDSRMREDRGAIVRELDVVFHSYEFEGVAQFLHEHHVRYIVIDERMKNGLVWHKEDEGFLFLLHQSSSFTLLYESGGVEIWQFL